MTIPFFHYVYVCNYFRFDINFDLDGDGLADRGEAQAFFARAWLYLLWLCLLRLHVPWLHLPWLHLPWPY